MISPLDEIENFQEILLIIHRQMMRQLSVFYVSVMEELRLNPHFKLGAHRMSKLEFSKLGASNIVQTSLNQLSECLLMPRDAPGTMSENQKIVILDHMVPY